MNLISIFKPDILDYADYGYKKPIKYTGEFLKQIADNTDSVLLNEEHSDKIIGSLDNFTYEDGALKCAVSDGIDISGKGISPKFEFDLVEYDEFLLAKDGRLIDAGLTDNPRSHIVCNSIKNGENVSNEVLEQTMKRTASLERELAKKDNELMEMQKKLEVIDDMEKTIEKLQKENKKYASNYEELTEKAKAYDDNVAQKKTEIIDKIAGDDEQMKERLQNHSLQQLEDVFDVYKLNTDPVGIPSGEDSGEGEPEPEDKDVGYDEINSVYKEVFGKDMEFKC